MTEFKDLVGKTLTAVRNDGDEVVFYADDGTSYKLYHSQDCCESVRVEDVCGDLNDLVGSPIVQAEENSSNDNAEGLKTPEWAESFTWTFYRIATAKGQVVLRWLGTSNGYYSESVSFCQLS